MTDLEGSAPRTGIWPKTGGLAARNTEQNGHANRTQCNSAGQRRWPHLADRGPMVVGARRAVGRGALGGAVAEPRLEPGGHEAGGREEVAVRLGEQACKSARRTRVPQAHSKAQGGHTRVYCRAWSSGPECSMSLAAGACTSLAYPHVHTCVPSYTFLLLTLLCRAAAVPWFWHVHAPDTRLSGDQHLSGADAPPDPLPHNPHHPTWAQQLARCWNLLSWSSLTVVWSVALPRDRACLVGSQLTTLRTPCRQPAVARHCRRDMRCCEPRLVMTWWCMVCQELFRTLHGIFTAVRSAGLHNGRPAE
jgi:hypothetical protein